MFYRKCSFISTTLIQELHVSFEKLNFNFDQNLSMRHVLTHVFIASRSKKISSLLTCIFFYKRFSKQNLCDAQL